MLQLISRIGGGTGFEPATVMNEKTETTDDGQIQQVFLLRTMRENEAETLYEAMIHKIRPFWYANFVTVFNRNQRGWNAVAKVNWAFSSNLLVATSLSLVR